MNALLATAEALRLKANRERTAYWKRWGPYLSERQWGTVREDYSATGDAWEYFPHEQARSRAYRWGEDGIAGISDNHQRLCFAIALWNGEDPILKERLFGLTNAEGNHGEDVKETYFYLDNTPTHAYMKMLYKYPQAAFPYADLIDENGRRDQQSPEYELLDTGIFEGSRYYDVVVEYAKASPEDILIKISVTNRDTQTHTLKLLPTLWFRNTWAWDASAEKPQLALDTVKDNYAVVQADHPTLGRRSLYCNNGSNNSNSETSTPELLFTENDTNSQRLFNVPNPSPYVKDGINSYVVEGCKDAVNPQQRGTKMSACYACTLQGGETQVITLRLSDQTQAADPFDDTFAHLFQQRRHEADAFYQALQPVEDDSTGLQSDIQTDKRAVQRQAWAGLLWSKQYYYYVVSTWLAGDPAQPSPPPERSRNRRWQHLFCDDVLSMPDKWEYPWFAAWDLAFHAVSLALIDPDLAKLQLQRLTREWYMHPNGQLPAYEWAFDDVNPPIHAWAILQVYQLEKEIYGRSDRAFLEGTFQKLLFNFTWWVNQEDKDGCNVFEGGFLGLDNISVFNRSQALPTGGFLEQADGTSWMAMYCLNLLEISLELAPADRVYEDIASKFFEHFVYIADAMNNIGRANSGLWNEEDQFFYDLVSLPDGQHFPLKVRSIVGIIPLFAVTTLRSETLDQLPNFKRRIDWFKAHRPQLVNTIVSSDATAEGTFLLSLVPPAKLKPILTRLLDEDEFLSPYGIRSVSRYHAEHPYSVTLGGQTYSIDYEPAESSSRLFGGNSNWRGPIWFPINYLLISSLYRFYDYLGEDVALAYPTHSSHLLTLEAIAQALSHRLVSIFLKDDTGKRPMHGGLESFDSDPHWQDLLLFYEYFHGDNGAGLGASHQTGWTALVANLIRAS